MGTFEQHSSAGSCGLGVSAAALTEPGLGMARHTRARVAQPYSSCHPEKVPGNGSLARMGRLCLACSNEHGWELAGGKSEQQHFLDQQLETERPRELFLSLSILSELCFETGNEQNMPKI